MRLPGHLGQQLACTGSRTGLVPGMGWAALLVTPAGVAFGCLRGSAPLGGCVDGCGHEGAVGVGQAGQLGHQLA